MSKRFRPRLEGLETRSVPASLFASALEWVPNPAADCPIRVMDQQAEEAVPATAILWESAPAASLAVASTQNDDALWVGFQAEHAGYGNGQLLTDWVFSEDAAQSA